MSTFNPPPARTDLAGDREEVSAPRFVGRRFVTKGVTFLDFTLKRPLVVHIDEPRPRLMSSTSPFRTDAPRSGLGREFCGRFTLQYDT